MKEFFSPGIFVLILLFCSMPAALPQCEPDTVNCVDINEPGQICPTLLANGYVGAEYEEIITVITPDVAIIGEAQIEILKITLDSIHNLPAGLEFYGEAAEFLANEVYCVIISGTPTDTGNYYLKIYVTPYIDFFGTPLALGPQVDSTSVSLAVEASSGIQTIDGEDFALINAYPNPFITSTKIGYLEPDQGEAELRIMNMLGKEIHSEKIMAVKGENYFRFSGDNLSPGYYLYAIIRDQKSLQGKLIKRK